MTTDLSQPNQAIDNLKNLGVNLISKDIIQTNNLSQETLNELGVTFEEFISDFSNFYTQIADSNSDFIQKNPIESLIKTIEKGDAVFTFKLDQGNGKNTKYEIIGFAKISAYTNTADGIECNLEAENAIKIIEIGNLMTKPGFTGHGIATKGVLQCLNITAVKYPDYHPIAVVHTKNHPSLGVFGKFVKAGVANLFQNWPQWVAHSDHEGLVYTDDMEVCFDLYDALKELSSLHNLLLNNNSDGSNQPKEA
jgi:hypothetical protein